MSNALTTAARPLVMDPSAKAVLMALCDMARETDDPDKPGQAWPPMQGQDGAIGLCDWTCLSERSVQRGMKLLIAAGHVSRRQLRHGVVYTVHPSGGAPTPARMAPLDATPDKMTGVNEQATPVILALTPVNMTPKAQQSISKRKKTTSSPSTRAAADERAASAFDDLPPLPTGATRQQWQDYADMREAMARADKRRPWTATTGRKAIEKLHTLAAAGNDPGAVLDQSVLNTWQGLFPVKDDQHGQRGYAAGGRGNAGAGRDRPVDGFAAALREAATGGRADHHGGG